MSILDKVADAYKAALKAGDRVASTHLSFVRAEIQKLGMTEEGRREILDQHIVPALHGMVKKSREAIDTISNSTVENRDQAVTKLNQEIERIKSFLPSQMSADQLRETIQGYVQQGVNSVGDIMKQLREHHLGTFDNKAASEIAKELTPSGGDGVATPAGQKLAPEPGRAPPNSAPPQSEILGDTKPGS